MTSQYVGTANANGRGAVRALAFDLDGTLIDSNAVKVSAYYDIFGAAAKESVDRGLREDRFGNRFSKIATILRLMGREAATVEVDRLAGEYNRITESHQLACPERPGASRILESLAARLPLYVCSGTFEETLVRVIYGRGWSGLFRAIFGSPRSKKENVERVAEHAKIDPASILLVGDTIDDKRGAELAGTRFAALRADSNDFDPAGVTIIDQLSQLEALC